MEWDKDCMSFYWMGIFNQVTRVWKLVFPANDATIKKNGRISIPCSCRVVDMS